MVRNVARWMVAVLGASGVAAAAFYAHGLAKIASEQQMRWWAIGCAIQLVTAPAALALMLAMQSGAEPRAVQRLLIAVGLLLAGTMLFSGSLYAMALGMPRAWGAITPCGGLLLIAGWCSVGALSFRR